MIRGEQEDADRIIYEDSKFLAFCPFVSRFPYEVWILPKKHSSDFVSMDKDHVQSLARALRDSLARIKALLSDPPYNFIIHSSP